MRCASAAPAITAKAASRIWNRSLQTAPDDEEALAEPEPDRDQQWPDHDRARDERKQSREQDPVDPDQDGRRGSRGRRSGPGDEDHHLATLASEVWTILDLTLVRQPDP
jgi:hypothetical protein